MNLDPRVYERAARRMLECEYACQAISAASTGDQLTDNVFVAHFADWFEPRGLGMIDNWFGPFTKENQQARILALLFMAEITRSEKE